MLILLENMILNKLLYHLLLNRMNLGKLLISFKKNQKGGENNNKINNNKNNRPNYSNNTKKSVKRKLNNNNNNNNFIPSLNNINEILSQPRRRVRRSSQYINN